MLYSKYHGKSADKEVLKLQEAQNKESAEANKAKREATNHEEKLRIAAKSRAKIAQLTDDKNKKAKAKEAKELKKKLAAAEKVKAASPVAPKAPSVDSSVIDLKDPIQVASAIEKALKAE